MSKYSAKYIEENAIDCSECGKRIWRETAMYADGIQVCSVVCREMVLGNIAEFFAKSGAR